MDLQNEAIELQKVFHQDYKTYWEETEAIKAHLEARFKALGLYDVGNSSDLIVVELSDDEIKIISEQELKEWQQSAIEFDGFEAWTVKGRLVKNR